MAAPGITLSLLFSEFLLCPTIPQIFFFSDTRLKGRNSYHIELKLITLYSYNSYFPGWLMPTHLTFSSDTFEQPSESAGPSGGASPAPRRCPRQAPPVRHPVGAPSRPLHQAPGAGELSVIIFPQCIIFSPRSYIHCQGPYGLGEGRSYPNFAPQSPFRADPSLTASVTT